MLKLNDWIKLLFSNVKRLLKTLNVEYLSFKIIMTFVFNEIIIMTNISQRASKNTSIEYI